MPHAFSAAGHGDRQAALDRRLEDRQVPRLAVRALGAAAEENLDEAPVLRDPADLRRRSAGVLAVTGGSEARLLGEPALTKPVVVSPREDAGARYGLWHERGEARVVGVQDPDVGPGRVEHVAADGGSRSAPGGPLRPCSTSCRNHDVGCAQG